MHLSEQDYQHILSNDTSFYQKQAFADQIRKKWKISKGYGSKFDRLKKFRSDSRRQLHKNSSSDLHSNSIIKVRDGSNTRPKTSDYKKIKIHNMLDSKIQSKDNTDSKIVTKVAQSPSSNQRSVIYRTRSASMLKPYSGVKVFATDFILQGHI